MHSNFENWPLEHINHCHSPLAVIIIIIIIIEVSNLITFSLKHIPKMFLNIGKQRKDYGFDKFSIKLWPLKKLFSAGILFGSVRFYKHFYEEIPSPELLNFDF
jgi:hypothetical protein